MRELMHQVRQLGCFQWLRCRDPLPEVLVTEARSGDNSLMSIEDRGRDMPLGMICSYWNDEQLNSKWLTAKSDDCAFAFNREKQLFAFVTGDIRRF